MHKFWYFGEKLKASSTTFGWYDENARLRRTNLAILKEFVVVVVVNVASDFDVVGVADDVVFVFVNSEKTSSTGCRETSSTLSYFELKKVCFFSGTAKA